MQTISSAVWYHNWVERNGSNSCRLTRCTMLSKSMVGPSFPWHGGNGSIDGAFNAVSTVSSNVQEDTRYPRITTPTIPTTAGLSTVPGAGWQIAYGTSWHFGVEFNASGPKAFGLLSYSQSSNPASPFFNDQQQRYSDKNMRAIPFSESEISADVLPNGTITIRR